MLIILLFVPARLRGPVLHRLRHRRVARRLGAAHRRRHLHQDRRHRLRPDEDRLQHQGRRRAQPRRHRRLHRRQRRRLGRPDRRRLRDLRRHRRRAHRVHPPRRARTTTVQVKLLVWIFAMRVLMIIASGSRTSSTRRSRRPATSNADKMNFEAPLTQLVWLTSIVSVVHHLRRRRTSLIADLGGDRRSGGSCRRSSRCGTLAGAIIPEFVKVFTSIDIAHVHEVVTSSQEGGASLNILSGLVAGNFSAFWMGIVHASRLMGAAYFVSRHGPRARSMTIGGMDASPVFAFGLVAFGFLGMGPVTIAVDSYGPVTDNAQSVFELSLIEHDPGHQGGDQEGLRLRPRLRARPSTSSRRTTAPATPSRPPPSRCSSARPSSAPRR